MTSRRASKRDGHRPRPRRRDPHDDWATMLAWCDGTPDALDECMRTSHDKLIAMMGDLRTGGVRWQVSENVDHARTMCDLYVEGLGASMSEELGNYVRQIRGKLREYGGTVVMTMAPGRPTVRPRPGAPVQEDHG